MMLVGKIRSLSRRADNESADDDEVEGISVVDINIDDCDDEDMGGYCEAVGRDFRKNLIVAQSCDLTDDTDLSEVDSFPLSLSPRAANAAVSGSVGPRTPRLKQKADNVTESLLWPSRFPRVPPTIRFASPDRRKIEKPKKSQRKLLKWCHNSLIPKVVRRLLANSHFEIVPESQFWIGYWGRHLRSTAFRSIEPYQKVNHFPGTFHLGRKDRLWYNMLRMAHLFPDDYHIMPKTYTLPRESAKLRRKMREIAARNEKQRFILKPPASARGTGVRLVHRFSQIASKQPLIAQLYIERPYLIQGSKFDLRVYVYVPSFNPLRIYMFEDGLVRFASVKYSYATSATSNKYMHLTNYSINKEVQKQPQDQDASVTGHKWTLKQLWRHLAAEGKPVRTVMERMVDLILKTIIACEGSINSFVRMNTNYSFTCHELFGFDIMLDESLKPWLLEVNISPSLHSATDLDAELKSKVACDVLNMSRLRLPDKHVPRTSGRRMPADAAESIRKTPEKPYSIDFRCFPCSPSGDELQKQAYYVNRFQQLKNGVNSAGAGSADPSILSCLTPNDVRVLVETEDEWEKRGSFTRLFPSPFSSSYLRFFDCAKYYDLLLDQWVAQYYHIREAGCSYLEALCSRGVHLEKESLSSEHVWSHWKAKSDNTIV